VRKADGTQELFSEKKLMESLRASGVNVHNSELIQSIVDRAHGAETTEHIFGLTLEELKKQQSGVAARYSIKRAVLALGPTGFPFEKYMAEVLKEHGAKSVVNNVTINGKCVPHEVDILFELKGRRVGIESKFHNSLGTKTDIKDILYVHARYHDLSVARDSRVDEGWLISNTRMTTQAMQYALCSGIIAIGWDHPRGKGIQQLIEAVGLHPVTTLTTLTTAEHNALIASGVIVAKSLRDRKDILQKIHVEESRHMEILTECAHVCASIHHSPYEFDFSTPPKL
jgi:Restriction endonuclease